MAAPTGPTASSSAAAVPRRFQTLPPRSEYRFELAEQGERLSIRLVPRSGAAEIFGAEMVPAEERWYAFAEETKAAHIAGTASTEYLADEPSPIFTAYANLHLHLERLRLLARNHLRSHPDYPPSTAPPPLAHSGAQNNTQVEWGSLKSEAASRHGVSAESYGPRVLVLGPEGSGKTSLVKLLANYALKSPAVGRVVEPTVTAAGTAVSDTAVKGRGEGDEEEEDGKKENTEAEKERLAREEAMGWSPVIVNLDPGEGFPPIPQTFTLLPLSPFPTNGIPTSVPSLSFGTTPTTGAIVPTPNAAPHVVPLTYWLGRETVRDNERLTERVVVSAAKGTEERLAKDGRARVSGLLIDTAGITSADSRSRYAFIQHIVRAFSVDLILVLGHEKLHIEMNRLFGGGAGGGTNASAAGDGANKEPRISVLKLPKSGGVVEVDEMYRERLRSAQIRSYFYGGLPLPSSSSTASDGSSAPPLLPGHADPVGGLPPLSPHSTQVGFEALAVYRVGQESMAPSSALPIGASRTVTETQLVRLDPANSQADQAALLHSVLALVQVDLEKGAKAARGEEEVGDEVLDRPVYGFIHVANIDAVKKKFTILSPFPGRLPSRVALLGGLDWQDA